MTKQNLYLPRPIDTTDIGVEGLSFRNSLQSHDTAPGSAKRLVVLIPTGSAYIAETQRIWKLADAMGTSVLLLGVCRSPADEPGLRREFVAMSALMGNSRVSTEIKVEVGRSWVQAVSASYQTGDRIVCFAEHREGVFHTPLYQILEANLDIPVFILSELPSQGSTPGWFPQVVVWSGSIAILIGFGLLQGRIVQLPTDWFQTILLILSVAFEFRLIWVWNSLFN